MSKMRGYGPPKPKTTPSGGVSLDRFGNALAGDLVASGAYSPDIPGFPVRQGSNSSPPPGDSVAVKVARAALMGSTAPDEDPSAQLARLHNAGARIIQLAQCVREAGLCQEYLEYTTLPEDNNSGLFDVEGTWSGSGTRFDGNIKEIYDAAVASMPYVQPMFLDEDLEQFNSNPIIVFRLAYYIKAFMDECYKPKVSPNNIRKYGDYAVNRDSRPKGRPTRIENFLGTKPPTSPYLPFGDTP